MNILGYAVFYFLVAAMLFWMFYKTGVEMNFRFGEEFYKRQATETGTWRYIWNEEKAAWHIFCHDFFKLHCPWDWQVAVASRVVEARKKLKHSQHEKGWKLEDCDNPANHEQIAKDCFISRKRFWGKHVFLFMTMPIRGLLASAGLVIIVVVVMPLRWVWDKIPRKPRDYEKEYDEMLRKSSVEEMKHALWHARNEHDYWDHNMIVKLSYSVADTIPERFPSNHFSYAELGTNKEELGEIVERMKGNLFLVNWSKVLESNDIRAVRAMQSGRSCWPEAFAKSGIDPEAFESRSREIWQFEAQRLCQSIMSGVNRSGEEQIGDLERLSDCAYELKIPYFSPERTFGLDHNLVSEIMYEHFGIFCYEQNVVACVQVLDRHLKGHLKELEDGSNRVAQACLERFFSHPLIGDTAEPDRIEKIREKYETWKSRNLGA